MNSLSLSPAISGGESCSYVSGSHICSKKSFFGADLPRNSFIKGRGVWFSRQSSGRNGGRPGVFARIKKGQKHDYPWPNDIDPNWESAHLRHLSHFKPLAEKPKPVTLPFEKPLVDLQKKIIDVSKMAAETGLDFGDQINMLEGKYQQALKDLYTHLTPIQRLSIARHPNRPTFLDHVLNITDKWVELHGDRAGYDDPAIVSGIGSIDGKSYMFIGHQKGRNTKENIQRNFGMPTPHGYRKALRMMRYADHHGLPIITFIDTPGAFADLKSEELGQGEAIAYNLRAMFGLKVPIVTVVIGEGGSGGALAIGCANKIFMLENSVFYVASPEACAAILWKSAQAAPKAAEKLKITATELCKLKITDGIIPEPLGGAHTDPAWTSQQIKQMVTKAMEELASKDVDSLLEQRYQKFRELGGFKVDESVEEEKQRNMKKKEANLSQRTAEIEAEIENLKNAAEEAKGMIIPLPSISNEAVEILRQEVDKEMTKAFITMGLQEKLEAIKMENSKSNNTSDQALSPALKEKADRLFQEFRQNFAQPGMYTELKQKLQMLHQVTNLQERKTKGERLKKAINEKLLQQVKDKVEILRKARESVAVGEKPEESQLKEVERARAGMEEMLKSINLEVVGFSKKELTVPPALEGSIVKAEEVTMSEIKKAIDGNADLRRKLEEIKAELGNGSSKETVEKLEEIKKEILAAVDSTELKKKVETELKNEAGSAAEMPAQETIGAA